MSKINAKTKQVKKNHNNYNEFQIFSLSSNLNTNVFSNINKGSNHFPAAVLSFI